MRPSRHELTGYKNLKDFTDEELYQFLVNNETIDTALLDVLYSDILMNDFTNEELYEFFKLLVNDGTTDTGILNAISSEIIRRQLKESRNVK
jgi:hypothetical protein